MSSVQKQNSCGYSSSRPYVCGILQHGRGAMQKSSHVSLCCLGGIFFISMLGLVNYVKPIEIAQELATHTSIAFRQFETKKLQEAQERTELEPEPIIEKTNDLPSTNKLLADSSEFTIQEQSTPEAKPEIKPKPEPTPEPKTKSKAKPKPTPKPTPVPKPETPVMAATPVPPLERETALPKQQESAQSTAPSTEASQIAQSTQTTKASQSGLSAEQTRTAQNNIFNALLKEIERHKEYPRAARRKKIEGTVYLLVQLDAHGKVMSATLSSDNNAPAILSRATLRLGEHLVGFTTQNDLARALSLRIPIEYALR